MKEKIALFNTLDWADGLQQSMPIWAMTSPAMSSAIMVPPVVSNPGRPTFHIHYYFPCSMCTKHSKRSHAFYIE